MSSRSALLVIGGNGFVGSAVCAAAIARGVAVTSISRSGQRPSHLAGAAWSDSVQWEQGDALEPSSFAQALREARAVVVSVGSPPLPFVDYDYQVRANGETNAKVAQAARDAGVERLVIVNAAMPAWLDRVAPGYAEGKRRAAAAAADFASAPPHAAAVIKPSAIYGTRHESTPLGTMPIPLGLFLGPASFVLQRAPLQTITRLAPYAFDGALLPPVPVQSVAAAAVRCALDDGALRAGSVQTVDVDEILRAGEAGA